MTAQALKVLESDAPDLSGLTVAQLKDALLQCLRVTADGLRAAAAYVLELERRGEDLASLKLSMMKQLRLVAHGQVLPEVVVRFAGKPSLLDQVAALPIPDQQRLASGEPVKLLVREPTGQTTHRMVDPRDLRPEQMRQVFDRGEFRGDAGQAAWLDHQQTTAARAVPSMVGELKIDREADGFWLGRKFIPRADMEAALRALKR